MRKVASQAGAEKYGQPIGSIIEPGAEGPTAGGGDKGPVTMERLLSLQRQHYSARKRGDKNAMAALQETFNREGREYARGRSLAEVMGPLDEAYAKMVGE